MAVYRRPFDYASRQAARVEWQPQPSWVFDATFAQWEWTTYAASITLGIAAGSAAWAWTTYSATVTVSGDINVTGTLAAWEWQTYRANIASSRDIECSVAQWAWQGVTATLTAEPLMIPVAGISARASQSSMTARASQNDMGARSESNRILARVA